MQFPAGCITIEHDPGAHHIEGALARALQNGAAVGRVCKRNYNARRTSLAHRWGTGVLVRLALDRLNESASPDWSPLAGWRSASAAADDGNQS